MSDLTVYAEALIAATARAFYDDEAVALIDVLIRDKFLRDDDMAPRLNLPAKRLRQTLQFLQEEHLVRLETVDDLAQGGSQATKFYYLDYNRAVHSIRLRLHLLKQQLQQAELRARSSSFYLCPGYNVKRCNGRYTEEEAQQVVDATTSKFLCQECARHYENDPQPPPMETYTLQLVDNTKELKQAVDNLRRVNVQLSAKFIGNHQLRPGIYDLLQKVSRKGGGGGSSSATATNTAAGTGSGGGMIPYYTKQRQPITSNLPSENFALGIGSKRLAGTGRTAGIKAKKLEQAGMAESALQAQKYLVSTTTTGTTTTTTAAARGLTDQELIFLKNALGQELLFSVERGGGARAQLLASSKRKRRLRKLLDAAASRVGVSLPLPLRISEAERKKRRLAAEAEAAAAAVAAAQEEEDEEQPEKQQQQQQHKNRKKRKLLGAPEFLMDNIGRHGLDISANQSRAHRISDEEDLLADDNNNNDENDDEEAFGDYEMVLYDEAAELQQLPEENRLASFQTQYKLEVDRQEKLVKSLLNALPNEDDDEDDDDDDDDNDNADIVWEDGDGPE